MPRQLLVRTSFTQGVKTSFDPSVVPPNALWEAYNVRADESGILRVRQGVKVYKFLGEGRIQGATSAFDGILVAWNRNLYKFDFKGNQTTLGTEILGNTKQDAVEMIRWSRGGQEIVYLFTGNGIFESNGTSVSLVKPYEHQSGEPANLLRAADGTQDRNSGPARCRFAVLRASLSQRIAAAGDPLSPNTVYFSAPLDATYWPDNQVLQLPDDGGRITGLANWYGALIIFRDRDIWAFMGVDLTDANAALVLQDASVGCLSHTTIANVPGLGLVFLGPDNVYSLQQLMVVENQAKATPIGDDVRKYLAKAIQSGIDGVCAVYFDRQYRLSFPNARQDQRVFRLQLQNDAGWFMDTGPRTARFFIHDNTLYGVDVRLGEIHRFEQNWILDKQAGIPFYVAFRREDLQPGPSRIKRVFIYSLAKGQQAAENRYFFGTVFNTAAFNHGETRQVDLRIGTEQHLDVTLVVDGHPVSVEEFDVYVEREDSALNLGVEPVRIYEARFRPSLKGHFVQVRISARQPGEDIAILGYGIEYSTRGRIHGKRQ